MSRYDVLRKELAPLRVRQAVATVIPAVLLTVFVILATPPSRSAALSVLVGLAAVPLVCVLLHSVWKVVFGPYRAWAARSARIIGEIADLRARVATIFDDYRDRRKGEPFKKAYELAGKSVAQLEEALAIGMFRERREVFVTAFMRAGIAVRVTASIGSPYRCAASDNPARWAQHVERLGCDEVRHGETRPSPTDFRTSRALRGLLGAHGAKLKSFIICWNQLREWRVFEHDDDRRHWLRYEFDAAV